MGNQTTVKKYVTISQGNEQWNFANGRKLNDNDKSIKNHNNIFNVIRALDGNETDLTENDFEKLEKNQALIKSFGYTLNVEGKKYTLTSKDGNSISFKFEKLLEAFDRKLGEYSDKRAKEKSEEKIRNAEENLIKFQKEFGNKYDISFDKDDKTYQVTVNDDYTSVTKLAADLGLNELEVAKALKKELDFSITTDPESGLYDEEHEEMLKNLNATINNCEKNHPTSWANLNLYIIPEGFDLTIKI